MTSLESEIKKIRDRLDAATPGPYDSRVREFSNIALCEVWTEFGWYIELPAAYREATTELFANSPTDIAKLLRCVEVLSEACKMYAALNGGPIHWPDHDAYTYTQDPAIKALAEAQRILEGE